MSFLNIHNRTEQDACAEKAISMFNAEQKMLMPNQKSNIPEMSMNFVIIDPMITPFIANFECRWSFGPREQHKHDLIANYNELRPLGSKFMTIHMVNTDISSPAVWTPIEAFGNQYFWAREADLYKMPGPPLYSDMRAVYDTILSDGLYKLFGKWTCSRSFIIKYNAATDRFDSISEYEFKQLNHLIMDSIVYDSESLRRLNSERSNLNMPLLNANTINGEYQNRYKLSEEDVSAIRKYCLK